MTNENHQGHVAPAGRREEDHLVARVFGDVTRWHEAQEMLSDRILAPTYGRDVDQLERAGCEAIGERFHPADTSHLLCDLLRLSRVLWKR